MFNLPTVCFVQAGGDIPYDSSRARRGRQHPDLGQSAGRQQCGHAGDRKKFLHSYT